MPNWNGSDRRQRLPSDWPLIRERVLRRDGRRCTWIKESTGKRCTNPATDVDHIIPGDDHSDGNLRSLCYWHHQKKSSSEGGRALAAKRARIDSKYRRVEPHPGAL